jgi:hypothetical protein
MNHPPRQPIEVTRRGVLRHGKKVAYVAPVIIIAAQAQPGFAASAGDKDKDKYKK